MKKAVFFDWDGTLSFDGNHMSPENRKAIRKLQKKAIWLFYAQGVPMLLSRKKHWNLALTALSAVLAPML